MAQYLDGAPLVELASLFGIHRRTVAEHLTRRDVPIRHGGVDASRVHEAADLYGSGWALVEVGLKVGASERVSVMRVSVASDSDATGPLLTPLGGLLHSGVTQNVFASGAEAGRCLVTRTIPPSLAPVIAEFELEAADLVTTARLDEIVKASGVGTATRTVASRLRERGWLLPTGQRGVWEFAPGAAAGAVSRGGHTRLLRSVLAHGDVECGLTFQAAAWAHDLADRAPVRLEVSVVSAREGRKLPDGLDVSVFAPTLGYVTLKGVPVLVPASVLVHMAARPGDVRSWTSALEWLPDLAAEATPEEVLFELTGRRATVAARLGYLVQGLRPDISAQVTGPHTKTWFGPRHKVVRHDNHWQIADTLLPFDPRSLASVARAGA